MTLERQDSARLHKLYDSAMDMLESGEFEQATKALKKLSHEEYGNSSTGLGYALWMSDRREEAIQVLKGALNSDSSGNAALYLGQIYQEEELNDLAAKAYEVAGGKGRPVGFYRISKYNLLSKKENKRKDVEIDFLQKAMDLGHVFSEYELLRLKKNNSVAHWFKFQFLRIFKLIPKVAWIGLVRSIDDTRLEK